MQGTESEEIIKEPHLNNELLYQLQILAEVNSVFSFQGSEISMHD